MYCNNDAEDDLNLGFFTENCWFYDYDSYENLKPSLYTIETLEECTYLVLNKEGKSLLCESSPKFKVAFKPKLRLISCLIFKKSGTDAYCVVFFIYI